MSQKIQVNQSEPDPCPPQLRSELYRAIFKSSSEPIVILDPQGVYLEQNAAHAALLGYSDDDLKNQTPAIHMGPELFAKAVTELAANGEYRGEAINLTKDGQTRHVEITAFVMHDEAGKPLCYVGIKHDVTDRKRAEEALRRSEAELSDFFENASIGLHWVGPDGIVMRVNQAELELLGYSREEYVGHHIREFHVDGAVIEDILARLTAGEVLRDCDARMLCSDGTLKHVRINSSVYRENGKFIHTRCFTRDITERKRTEKRLMLQHEVTQILSEAHDFSTCVQRILETACRNLDWEVGGFWRVDRDQEVLRCVDICHGTSRETPEFDRMTKSITLKKGVGLPGRIWASGLPAWVDNVTTDPNLPRAAVALREGLRSAFGFPIVVGGDVLGVIDFFSKETREPDDELLKLIVGIGAQIGQFSERKSAEGKLAALLESERSARADAEKANRLKDEFLATLSHELRTPLNAVIGWSRMLSSGRLDAEASKHALEVVERNAWAQKQIIEDILDVSRVITGKLQLNLSPVDLVTIVDAALDAVRPAMEAKEIKIETFIDSSLRLISGDADRLQQVVWNVLSNAAKFTPAEGRIQISVKQESSQVEIEVQDSGPGIDPAFRPHVFERFRQADGSITRKHGGLGLGLAIVRHLLELHGGTIGVENVEDGTGAIFTVRLPLPSGELRPETLRSATEAFKEGRTDTLTLEDLRILIVDDEVDALDLIGVELSQRGAKVTGVTSVEEALNALQLVEFDLMISDIGMPDTDGYELIRQIRSQPDTKYQRIPAVALTAYARVQDRMRAIMAGFNTHVSKPVEANELITVVASLVGRLGQ